jgi:hypothetical protein
MKRPGAVLAAVVLAGAGSSVARAATWLDASWTAFDTSVIADGVGTLRRGQVLQHRWGEPPLAIDPGLPANVRIAALAVDGADLLFTADVAFALAGGAVATPRDVIRRHGDGTLTIDLAGAALGLPPNVRIDALAKSGNDYLFSVDISTRIGGVSVGPSDVLRWNGSSSVWQSASALGLAPNLNLTSLELLPNGHLLLGFDTAGKVGGTAFKAGELLEYAPSTAQWQLARPQSRLGVDCSPCRAVDAAVQGNPDVIFRSGMERY